MGKIMDELLSNKERNAIQKAWAESDLDKRGIYFPSFNWEEYGTFEEYYKRLKEKAKEVGLEWKMD